MNTNSQVEELFQNLTQWSNEMVALREIVLSCGLEEEYKWKNPCYCYKGANILMIAGFKNYCSISFFKGALLQDAEKLLTAPGENSKQFRMFKFTDKSEIPPIRDHIKAYIYEAIEIEKAGLKIETDNESEPMPEEFEEKLNADATFKAAFEALTPGRQRAYKMFIGGAKQSATRATRVEKYRQRILDGFGMNDCVCGLSKRMPSCDGSHKKK